MFVVEYNLIRNVMLSYLYCLIVVSYENYFYEFVISVACYNIYLLLICHKQDNKFYVHHHRHSIFFLFIHFYLVKIISINLIFNRCCPLTFHFNRLKEMTINPLNNLFKTFLMIKSTPLTIKNFH